MCRYMCIHMCVHLHAFMEHTRICIFIFILQEGRTRSRTASRLRITELFSSFSRLTRLDLSFNYILGCLGELLHSLSCPLEYLALRGCDLDESDLQALASSKHAASLRELNLSKLCQVKIITFSGKSFL